MENFSELIACWHDRWLSALWTPSIVQR